MICPQCKVGMVPGTSLLQRDLGGCMSYPGPGPCMRCPTCGRGKVVYGSMTRIYKRKCPYCGGMIALEPWNGVVRLARHGVASIKQVCEGSGMAKNVRDFMSGYRRYDPSIDGYGSPKDWSDAFQQRLGFEEAEAILAAQDETPRGILGVGPKASWNEIQKAYRRKAMACHPDMCLQHGLSPAAAEAAFKQLSAAFTVLERQFGKA